MAYRLGDLILDKLPMQKDLSKGTAPSLVAVQDHGRSHEAEASLPIGITVVAH
jgi:hypothetical protein